MKIDAYFLEGLLTDEPGRRKGIDGDTMKAVVHLALAQLTAQPDGVREALELAQKNLAFIVNMPRTALAHPEGQMPERFSIGIMAQEIAQEALYKVEAALTTPAASTPPEGKVREALATIAAQECERWIEPGDCIKNGNQNDDDHRGPCPPCLAKQSLATPAPFKGMVSSFNGTLTEAHAVALKDMEAAARKHFINGPFASPAAPAPAPKEPDYKTACANCGEPYGKHSATFCTPPLQCPGDVDENGYHHSWLGTTFKAPAPATEVNDGQR